jgi:hypothetical protein
MDVRVPHPAPSKRRWRPSVGHRPDIAYGPGVAWREPVFGEQGLLTGGVHRENVLERLAADPGRPRPARTAAGTGSWRQPTPTWPKSRPGDPIRRPLWRFGEGDACSPYWRVVPPVTSGAPASPRSIHATTHRKSQNRHRRRGVRPWRRSAGPSATGRGDGLYGALTASLPIDESPAASHGATGAHSGSAFQYGWRGFADKDLRQVLGQQVGGPLAKTYCGGGDLAACRDTLLATLKQATATPASEVYPGDDSCGAGDPWCADAIIHRALGGITHPAVHRQNRPTYQQVVEFPSHR